MTMNIWKDKVLPKIKKAFEKSPGKKALAAEAVKAFDESKDQHASDFEEKKGDLQSKVVEVYEASPPEVKALVKDPKVAGLKKNSAAVQKFLDELAKIEFPGAKAVSEAATKLGPAYVPGPITFLFEKVSSLLPGDVKEEAATAAEGAATTETATAESSATEEVKEKEIVVEAAKKEEEVVVAEATAEKVEAAAPAAEATPAAATEEAKKEEAPAASAAAAAEPPKA